MPIQWPLINQIMLQKGNHILFFRCVALKASYVFVGFACSSDIPKAEEGILTIVISQLAPLMDIKHPLIRLVMPRNPTKEIQEKCNEIHYMSSFHAAEPVNCG